MSDLGATQNGHQRIYTAINQKGGVGKTTILIHLALAAREAGLSVLVLDLDTQGSASVILTRDLSITETPGGADSLFRDPDAVRPIETPLGVDLLHGHQRLDRVDRECSLDDSPALLAVLRKLPYNLVLVDTPPALGVRHLAPLLWSDVAFTPLEPSSSSLQGLAQTTNTLKLARRHNARLASRVVINRHDKRSRSQRLYIEQLEERVRLVRPFLAQRVHVADALDAGVRVWRFQKALPELRSTWLAFCGGLLSHE